MGWMQMETDLNNMIMNLDEYMKGKKKSIDELSKEQLFMIGQKLIISQIKRAEYKKQYYQKKKRQILEQQHQYYISNRKERSRKSLEYYYKNREGKLEYQKKWNKEHRTKLEDEIEEAMKRG